jgi:hypothetical protein
LGTVFAGFHLVFIVLTLIVTGGSGEGQGMMVYVFDFPLVFVMHYVPGGYYVLYESKTAYILFFSIFGTLMYFGVGAILGFVIERLIQRIGGKDT